MVLQSPFKCRFNAPLTPSSGTMCEEQPTHATFWKSVSGDETYQEEILIMTVGCFFFSVAPPLLSASQPSLPLLLSAPARSTSSLHSLRVSVCLPPPPGSLTPSCWARLVCTPPGSLTLLLCPPLANRSTTSMTGACMCKCRRRLARFQLEMQPEWEVTTSTSLWVKCLVSVCLFIFPFIIFSCASCLMCRLQLKKIFL